MEKDVIYSFCPDYNRENVNKSINFVFDNALELVKNIQVAKKFL